MVDNYLGNLFIVAAPSGGGKTSLVKQLVSELDDIEISISHTTREKRPLEEHGKDYFFVNDAEFLKMIENNAFVEHAKVFDHYYGTSSEQIHERLNQGIDIILDIDWQGAQQIRNSFTNSINIFVIPPSLDVLKERLVAREQDHEQVIQKRMERAQEELRHYKEFDYIIVNDEFKVASRELQSIIIATRLNIKRQAQKQRELLSFLLASQ